MWSRAIQFSTCRTFRILYQVPTFTLQKQQLCHQPYHFYYHSYSSTGVIIHTLWSCSSIDSLAAYTGTPCSRLTRSIPQALAAHGSSGVTTMLYMCAIIRLSKSPPRAPPLPCSGRPRARGTRFPHSPASAPLRDLASAAHGRTAPPPSATIASTYASRSSASRSAGVVSTTAARTRAARDALAFHDGERAAAGPGAGCVDAALLLQLPPPPRRATLRRRDGEPRRW